MNTMKALVEIKEGAMTHPQVADILVAEDAKGLRLKTAAKSYKAEESACLEAATMLIEANKKLQDASKLTTVNTKKTCSSIKAAINELKDQMIKVDTILGDNVEHKIAQLERVAAALSTINSISNNEVTMKVVSAMVNR